MKNLEQLPESDAVQNHFSMLIAFTALERDVLISQKSHTPCVQQRLKHIDFMIDEYAIRVLERELVYEC